MFSAGYQVSGKRASVYDMLVQCLRHPPVKEEGGNMLSEQDCRLPAPLEDYLNHHAVSPEGYESGR